jgi:hypothetical protein
VDTTRTDHHPNNPSHPTPRARDLRERLDSAADEGLSRRRLDEGAFRRFVDDVLSVASAKASTSSSTSGDTPTTTSNRPQVVARGHQIRDIVADTWQAVLAANDPTSLVVRGGVLVRVKHDEA